MSDTVTKYPMLDRLEKLNIMSVDREGIDGFFIKEECDQYYYDVLTAQELAALGRELIELSETVNNAHSL